MYIKNCLFQCLKLDFFWPKKRQKTEIWKRNNSAILLTFNESKYFDPWITQLLILSGIKRGKMENYSTEHEYLHYLKSDKKQGRRYSPYL